MTAAYAPQKADMMHPAFIVPPVDEETVDLHRAMERLPERTRRMLEMRYAGDATLQDVGDEFGICRERVRSIERDAFKKLRRALRPPEHAPIAERLREYAAWREEEKVREAERQLELAEYRQRQHEQSAWSAWPEIAWRERRAEMLLRERAIPEWGSGTLVRISAMVRVRWNDYPTEGHIQLMPGDVLNTGERLALALENSGEGMIV